MEEQAQRKSTLDKLQSAVTITAAKTPYLENGKIDLREYDRLVERQIEGGVEGVIVGGTTGEGQLMDWDEHVMLISHTVNLFSDHILVIGNTGSNSTKEALHATEQGFAVGMHASLQINPYYGKTSMPGLVRHFASALDEGPAIIYNVPGRTGQDIPNDVVYQISSHPNFLGVKECTGNARIQGYANEGVRCWTGNDDEAHEGRHSFGSQGVISVTSNLLPGLFSRLMRTPNQELSDSLQELIAWLFCEPNPIGINTAMAMCGLAKPVFRLPYVPLSYEQRVKGAKLLEAVAEHIPGVQSVRVLDDADFILIGRH
ncbi:4-hydroxy-tetrahydrodipicolinate synthase 2, chloroplastic [Coccomyxa viridis]|uniref:4-hydroxy-tetrahydrodipicolinate synthase n=1 Tax=Coccomyxa viridis TaxID=1274662 RepID=A0AAV1HSQ8_9CHLO|nr:4-hydroxy-tetrahydrodipicolinate synthase 2, chloroplastic [Coccomyxa viridis]